MQNINKKMNLNISMNNQQFIDNKNMMNKTAKYGFNVGPEGFQIQEMKQEILKPMKILKNI